MSSWCAPAIRCTSCRDSSSQSVFVLYPPVRGAVIVDLAPDDLAVRFFRDGGTYWEQLERVFAREGLCAGEQCLCLVCQRFHRRRRTGDLRDKLGHCRTRRRVRGCQCVLLVWGSTHGSSGIMLWLYGHLADDTQGIPMVWRKQILFARMKEVISRRVAVGAGHGRGGAALEGCASSLLLRLFR